MAGLVGFWIDQKQRDVRTSCRVVGVVVVVGRIRRSRAAWMEFGGCNLERRVSRCQWQEAASRFRQLGAETSVDCPSAPRQAPRHCSAWHYSGRLGIQRLFYRLCFSDWPRFQKVVQVKIPPGTDSQQHWSLDEAAAHAARVRIRRGSRGATNLAVFCIEIHPDAIRNPFHMTVGLEMHYCSNSRRVASTPLMAKKQDLRHCRQTDQGRWQTQRQPTRSITNPACSNCAIASRPTDMLGSW